MPAAFDPAASLVQAFAIHERIHQYLLENIAPEAWNADPPDGKGRTVAALVAHIHNVRLMWLKSIEKKGGPELPAQLDRATVTIDEAKGALAASAARIAAVLEEGLRTGAVKGFKPDAGAFFAYLVAHEAHHRGQIASLLRRLGHPLTQKTQFGMWEWGTRAKEIGG
jgi:uncharacterized damage-inducible protein DinB